MENIKLQRHFDNWAMAESFHVIAFTGTVNGQQVITPPVVLNKTSDLRSYYDIAKSIGEKDIANG